MIDTCEPVARVMTKLQDLSVPVWKTVIWSRGLIEWLRKTEQECTTYGSYVHCTRKCTKLRYFVCFLENYWPRSEDEDERTRPTFQDIKLCVGWKVVNQTVVGAKTPNQKRPKKEVIVDWEERTVDESFSDTRTFASDLAESIEDRLDRCVNSESSSFFNISEIFKLLCGRRLPDGRVKLRDRDVEEYGLQDFAQFFKKICSLAHIREMDDERFDERLYASVLRSFKQTLRMLVWDPELKPHLSELFQRSHKAN